MTIQIEATKQAGETLPVRFVVFSVCTLFLLLLTGCSDSTTNIKASDQNDAAWQACLDTGGVPIRSAWSSQMSDCMYKPK